MSLTVVTGPKRSGKTGRIFEELKKSPENSYLIVPEQNLFFYETKILEVMGERGAFLLKTLSFLKLSLELLSEKEDFNELKLLDNETANMILASVILKNKSSLKLYKGGDKSDYRASIKSQISEFKKHLTDSDTLLNISGASGISETLSNKLFDISLIMKEYDERIKNVFSDSDGVISEAAELILENEEFSDKKIFIDGFTGFTGEELKLISAMNTRGCDIKIYLDYDPEYGKLIGDIYYSVGLSLKKLLKIIPDAEIKALTGCDVENPELKHLCENLFTQGKEFDGVPSFINLYKFKNPAREAEGVASVIAKMIAEGASPEEFMVVTSEGRETERIVKELKKFSVPSYAERKKSVSELPLYALVFSVFELLLYKPTTENIINYIKSLCFFDDEDVFAFENFLYSSGLKGWQIMGDKGVSYLIENAHEFDYSTEKKIRSVYAKTIKPLVKLKKEISKNREACEFAEVLYGFFKEIGLYDVISRISEEFSKDGDDISAIQYVQVYNSFIEILERSSLVLKNEILSFREFKNILFENFNEKNIAGLPLDCESVYVTDASAILPGVFSYVFLLSANDGLVDKETAEGFINESDRAVLKEFDIELSLSPEAKKVEEYLKIFTLLTSASEKLYISHTAFNAKGEETTPSDILYKLEKIFPKLSSETPSELIYSEKELLLKGISEIRSENSEEAEEMIRQVLESRNYGKKAYEALNKLGRKKSSEVVLDGVSEYLPRELKLSVTAMEKYRTCGFSYYVRYILKGKEKEIFSVDNAGIGLLSHMVMEQFSTSLKKEGKSFSEIDDAYIESKLDKIIDKAVAEVNGGLFDRGGRASYMKKKVKRDSKRSLKMICEHFKKGEFTEQAFELSFGREGDPLSGMEINLSEGRKIILSGTIDRVDSFSKNGADYIRIVDYKSTMKTLDLYEVYYGLNIQLITYLMVMLKSDINKKLLPGGVMYLSLENPLISVKNPDESDYIEAEIRKKLVMKGLFLNDTEIMSAMDRELLINRSSDIIELELDKNDYISSKNVLSIAEFEEVFKKLQSNIKETAEKIYGGEFKIRPVSVNGKSKCEYCPYSPICCFDNTFEYEEIKKEPFDKVLEKIKEGE